MILLLFIGSTLFARNSLKGQPILQQRLMKLIVWTGLYSDVSVAWFRGGLVEPETFLRMSIEGIRYETF